MKITRSIRPLLAFAMPVMAMGMFSSCTDEDDQPPVVENRNIVEVTSANTNFSTLVTAVQVADLEATLAGEGPFTVFAPNNEAFARYVTDNSTTEEDLLASGELATVLNYHIVNAEVNSGDVNVGRVNTAATVPFYVSKDPNDEIWINGSSRVIQTDINASNGVIHVLEDVIVAPTQNIAEIVSTSTTDETPEFTQLLAALNRANLTAGFNGGVDDNFTVFAPSDAAFQDLFLTLGITSVEEIPVETLTEILQYHVVNQRVFTQDLREDGSFDTLLDEQALTVNLADLQINDSGLVNGGSNIHATNGVIHKIDKVLIP
jgi:uncharacterized surface protein with fasciclin (FAS1) repeats